MLNYLPLAHPPFVVGYSHILVTLLYRRDVKVPVRREGTTIGSVYHLSFGAIDVDERSQDGL